MTVVGVHNGNVYAIDYGGLVRVLESVYVANVKAPHVVAASGAMIWVRKD